MVNLKSDWHFSAYSLDLAAKDDHFALRICAVDLKNEPLTAESFIKIKTCLAGEKISVEVADIKFEPIRDGAKSTLQDIYFFRRETASKSAKDAAGPSPRDPYRHALARRPLRKAWPFCFVNYSN